MSVALDTVNMLLDYNHLWFMKHLIPKVLRVSGQPENQNQSPTKINVSVPAIMKQRGKTNRFDRFTEVCFVTL